MEAEKSACAELLPWVWPRAAYIHIPFCAHHCCYCDFAVAAGQDQVADRYLDALEMELRSLGSPQLIATLFIGGGTPTHLNVTQLARLFTMLATWLPLRPGHECSIEANPNDVTADKVALLADAGVNRVSLGVQSFRPQLLHFLERSHDAAIVFRAVDLLRKRIDNISLDLIFGVPGQTEVQWQEDLRTALQLEVGHVSTYGLTYEKGTRLWKNRDRGVVDFLDEEAELALYCHAMDTLENAGLEQYEISSFGRPGMRCRHNQVYWANHAYFGFGMGAARYVRGRRETNSRDLQTYLRRVEAGESAVFQSEELSSRERATETLALNLRRAEGIVRTRYGEQTGFSADEVMSEAFPRLVADGFLAEDKRGIRLTRRGRCVADRVISELL